MVFPQFLATTIRVIARYFVVVLCLFVCLFIASVPVSSGVASSGSSRTNHYDATEELHVLLEAAAGESFEKELKTQYCKQYLFRAVKG